MTTEKTCFIIMPVTTTKEMAVTYNDADHFEHVLNHLFVPAIEAAGYKPITPISEGSDIIHADIITNLDTADMVLCDLSGFNPNVFFELGIRTSLNKPVCIVKDELTPEPPFDVSPINNQNYLSGMMPWVLEDEKKKLTKHFLASVKRSKGKNTMWNIFHMTNQATVPTGDISKDDKLDYLTMQMNTIQKNLADQWPSRYSQPQRARVSLNPNDAIDDNFMPQSDSQVHQAIGYIERRIPTDVKHGGTIYDSLIGRLIVSYTGKWDGGDRAVLSTDVSKYFGLKIGYQPV